MIKPLAPVKRVIIAGSSRQEAYADEISRLLFLLRKAGIEVRLERQLAGVLSHLDIGIPSSEIIDSPDPEAQAVISLGGDGTFLRVARWIGKLEIPVLGINTGHLGFLASYTPAESEELVELLRSGEALVEQRIALQVEVPGDCESPSLPYALNEVAILKEDTSSMINVHAEIENHFLADYLADGLLISTPTGSTGYNLSAGGPILVPTLDAIVLTPIAPHTLTFRPLVVSGGVDIMVTTDSRAPRYRVSLDGVSFLMENRTTVRIRKADFTPLVIRSPRDSFANTLRAKLHWGIR